MRYELEPMLAFPAAIQIYVALEPVDMRKQYDGQMGGRAAAIGRGSETGRGILLHEPRALAGEAFVFERVAVPLRSLRQHPPIRPDSLLPATPARGNPATKLHQSGLPPKTLRPQKGQNYNSP